MPAAKQYIVLHEFDTRVNDDTGEEKKFLPGDVYDGPADRVPLLLSRDVDPNLGPLIAEKSSDAAQAVASEGN